MPTDKPSSRAIFGQEAPEARSQAILAAFTAILERKTEIYGSGARWLKIKNPNYTQAERRRELFDSFRPGPKQAKLPAASVEKTGA